ncbi:MAG: hypothetical protein KAW92_11695 [Candidatus Cloacimonetes bacterium]|nr:hypothetical protein [Candidatus Cloacimonadota bacterium]
MIKSKKEEFFTLKFKCKCGNILKWGVGTNAVVRKICECGKIYVLDKATLSLHEEQE